MCGTHDRSASRWDRLPDSAIPFWYRQSPRLLERRSFAFATVGSLPASPSSDPPVGISGECLIGLDGRGRLSRLEVMPPQVEESSGTAQAPDWSVLFREAGVDPAKWIAAEPIWTPPLYADTRAAWRGVLSEHPDVPMRIEAAAYRGKPVFWQLIGPWTNPSRMSSPTYSPGSKRQMSFSLPFWPL